MTKNYFKSSLKIGLPYIVLFAVALYVHLLWEPFGDDTWFATILDNRTIGEYYLWRYQTWSSRLIVESVLIFMCRSNIILWRILNSAIIVLLVYSLVELIGNNQNRKVVEIWTVLGIVLLFPFVYLSSAGWIATTLNYLWPLSLGLYGLIPLKCVLEEKGVPLHKEILAILALLYASNTEQMAAMLFMVYLIAIIYYYKKNKHLSKVLVINLTAVTINLCIILTCAGNSNRTAAELHWFPGFEHISFLQKIAMSFVTTTIKYWYEQNNIYLVYTLVVMLGVWLANKKTVYRIIGTIPFMYYLFCIKGLGVIFRDFPSLAIYNPLQYTTQLGFGNISYYIYGIINLILLFINIYCFYLIFKNERHFYIVSLALFAGIASRVIVGLSPTFFASGERTAVYFVFSMIGIILYIVLNCLYKKLASSDLVAAVSCIVAMSGLITFL